MQIKEDTHDYSRRMFLDKVTKGVAGAGLLTPLWPLISQAQDISAAYPEELLSIERYQR